MFKFGCLSLIILIFSLFIVIYLYFFQLLVIGVLACLINKHFNSSKKTQHNEKHNYTNNIKIEPNHNTIDSDSLKKRQIYKTIASNIMEKKYGKNWMFLELDENDEKILDELRSEICK